MEFTAAIVCHEMGWTWQEYETQPSWFITIVVRLLHAEKEHLKRINYEH